MSTKRTNRAARRTTYPHARLLRWSWLTDRSGDFRVHARTVNGTLVFASTEGYKRLSRAVENAALFGCPPSLRAVPATGLVEAMSLGEAP